MSHDDTESATRLDLFDSTTEAAYRLNFGRIRSGRTPSIPPEDDAGEQGEGQQSAPGGET